MNSFITMIFAILFTVLLCLNPALSLEAAFDALILCGKVLIPSLFPFFVFSSLLISSGAADRLCRFFGIIMRPVFGLRSICAAPLILGLLSGYPMGAHLTAELYKNGSITKDEAHRLLAFANNSGPLFIIGAVGVGIFKNAHAGYYLYTVHAAAALLTGIILNISGKKSVLPSYVSKQKNSRTASLPDAVKASVTTMFNLCGFVVFFAVVLKLSQSIGITGFMSNILCFFGIDEGTAHLISSGIFEITTALSQSSNAALPAVSMIISLGGASVLLQTMNETSSASLSLKPYIIGKLLCAVVSALLTFLTLPFFPQAVAVFADNAAFIEEKTLLFVIYIATTFLMCVLLYSILLFTELYEKRKRKKNNGKGL